MAPSTNTAQKRVPLNHVVSWGRLRQATSRRRRAPKVVLVEDSLGAVAIVGDNCTACHVVCEGCCRSVLIGRGRELVRRGAARKNRRAKIDGQTRGERAPNEEGWGERVETARHARLRGWGPRGAAKKRSRKDRCVCVCLRADVMPYNRSEPARLARDPSFRAVVGRADGGRR